MIFFTAVCFKCRNVLSPLDRMLSEVVCSVFKERSAVIFTFKQFQVQRNTRNIRNIRNVRHPAFSEVRFWHGLWHMLIIVWLLIHVDSLNSLNLRWRWVPPMSDKWSQLPGSGALLQGIPLGGVGIFVPHWEKSMPKNIESWKILKFSTLTSLNTSKINIEMEINPKIHWNPLKSPSLAPHVSGLWEAVEVVVPVEVVQVVSSKGRGWRWRPGPLGNVGKKRLIYGDNDG